MTASLFAADQGVGSRAIVLLHGFGGCHEIWSEVISSLSPARRVLAYDLPGHGLSLDFPAAGPAKVAAGALFADLSVRGLTRVHLVGHSMGGAVATLMALAQPQRVASLTLLAPGGFGPEINGLLLRRYAKAARKSGIRKCLAAMSGPGCVPAERIVAALCRMRARSGQISKLSEIAAAMTRENRQGVIPRDRLCGLDMPVMVVWGTDDTVLPFSQADDLPVHFHVHHVLQAGHMLVDEAPDLVAEAIRRNTNRRATRRRQDFVAAAG